MLIIMTSPSAVLSGGTPAPQIAQVLIDASAGGNPVGLISNHAEPSWFNGVFGSSNVQFLRNYGRQNGEVVSVNAQKFGLHPYDVLVLAANEVDVQMGKNGQAVLVAAGWSGATQVQALGIRVDTAAQLQDVINLTAGWSGQWWFTGNAPRYQVRALSDLSGYGKTVDQQEFARRLTNTVKNGGGRLNGLLVVTARSLLMDGTGSVDDLVWGVYPSSNSSNDDTDTLSDFTHRLRTTISRVRYAAKGKPLFIRHTPSPKRSAGGGGDRTDPTSQILTLHLNPYYRQNNRLKGKNVIVVDDCTTYGVSFGVAAAFLRKAGAATVTGIALGKFGNQLRHYEIDILTDPFAPVVEGGFNIVSQGLLTGATNTVAQQVLQALIQ